CSHHAATTKDISNRQHSGFAKTSAAAADLLPIRRAESSITPVASLIRPSARAGETYTPGPTYKLPAYYWPRLRVRPRCSRNRADPAPGPSFWPPSFAHGPDARDHLWSRW